MQVTLTRRGLRSSVCALYAEACTFHREGRIGELKAVLNRAQQATIKQLREELGEGEQTEHLIDWLLDAWEIFEYLRDLFGDKKAIQIFTAYAAVQEAVMV